MPQFRKSGTNHNAGWAKNLFTDVVTLEGPAKLLFVSGIGAEDPNAADLESMKILGAGDFEAQARISFTKIRDILVQHGATFEDVVRMTAYVLDAANLAQYAKVQGEFLQGASYPPHTFLQVAGLAHAEMLIEIEVTVALPVSRDNVNPA